MSTTTWGDRDPGMPQAYRFKRAESDDPAGRDTVRITSMPRVGRRPARFRRGFGQNGPSLLFLSSDSRNDDPHHLWPNSASRGIDIQSAHRARRRQRADGAETHHGRSAMSARSSIAELTTGGSPESTARRSLPPRSTASSPRPPRSRFSLRITRTHPTCTWSTRPSAPRAAR